MQFTLAKRAKSAGGDKYIATDNPDFNIYIPQEISRRTSKEPQQSIQITIESLDSKVESEIEQSKGK